MSPARKTSAPKGGSKTTPKKTAARKATPKKTTAKKATPRKTAVKKTTAKAAPKKTNPKKTNPKKTNPKRTAVKKTTAKATPKKVAPKKTTAKKTAAKRSTATKAAPKKTAAKKTAARNPAPKKTAAKTASGVRSAASRPAAPKPRPARPMKLDPQTLAGIRAKLEQELTDLKGQYDELDRESFEGTQSDLTGEVGLDEDFADAGTATFERERDLSIRNNIQDLMDQVQRAIERIDEGVYGTCERCGRPIDAARLKALPHASLCMDCKRREERLR